jgi:hypothetical protein
MFGTSTVLTYRQRPLLLKNVKGDLAAWPGGHPGSVFANSWVGRGAASGDIWNDGSVDLVAANLGQRAYVLRNNAGKRNHWIGIKTVGTRSNRDGIGCKLKVVGASGFTQYFTVHTAGSYLSASDRRVVAGLGADETAKLIELRWPSGILQRLENVRAGQWLTVTEPN